MPEDNSRTISENNKLIKILRKLRYEERFLSTGIPTILNEPANGLADTIEEFQFLPGVITAVKNSERDRL
jgi:hypothetical protein